MEESGTRRIKGIFRYYANDGIDKKPVIDMCRETHGVWKSTLIKSIMSRDRFKIIGKFLNVGDPSIHDKLNRIRFLSKKIEDASIQLYKTSTRL